MFVAKHTSGSLVFFCTFFFSSFPLLHLWFMHDMLIWNKRTWTILELFCLVFLYFKKNASQCDLLFNTFDSCVVSPSRKLNQILSWNFYALDGALMNEWMMLHFVYMNSRRGKKRRKKKEKTIGSDKNATCHAREQSDNDCLYKIWLMRFNSLKNEFNVCMSQTNS